MEIVLLWLWSPALAIVCADVLILMLIAKALHGRPRDWRWFLLPSIPLAVLLVVAAFLLIDLDNLAHM